MLVIILLAYVKRRAVAHRGKREATALPRSSGCVVLITRFLVEIAVRVWAPDGGGEDNIFWSTRFFEVFWVDPLEPEEVVPVFAPQINKIEGWEVDLIEFITLGIWLTAAAVQYLSLLRLAKKKSRSLEHPAALRLATRCRSARLVDSFAFTIR